MALKLLYLSNILLEAATPVTGDTRNMKTPLIVAVVAVVLIIACLALSKPKKKDNSDNKK